MNVLQLTNKVPFPPNDGGAIASLDLSKMLLSTGAHVQMLAMNTQKHYQPNCKKSAKDFHSNFTLICVDVPAKIKATQALFNLVFSKKPYNAQRFMSKSYQNKLIQLLETNTFNYVIFDTLYTLPYLPIIKQYSEAKIIYRAHNIESQIWNRLVQNSKPPKKWYLRNLSKRINSFEISFINKYDALLGISPNDLAFFQEKGNNKPAFLLQTSIDPALYSISNPDTTDVDIFHIGGLDWQPNIEGLQWFLHKVWPQLSDKYPNLKWHIAGRNATKELREMFQNKPNIIFHGEVASSEEYFNKHHIMIVPLFSGSGMRIKIIEAFAHQKAVISTSIGIEGINAKNKIHYLEANNKNEFLSAISILIEDKQIKNNIAQDARQFISDNFNTFANAKKLNAFLNSIH